METHTNPNTPVGWFLGAAGLIPIYETCEVDRARNRRNAPSTLPSRALVAA